MSRSTKALLAQGGALLDAAAPTQPPTTPELYLVPEILALIGRTPAAAA